MPELDQRTQLKRQKDKLIDEIDILVQKGRRVIDKAEDNRLELPEYKRKFQSWVELGNRLLERSFTTDEFAGFILSGPVVKVSLHGLQINRHWEERRVVSDRFRNSIEKLSSVKEQLCYFDEPKVVGFPDNISFVFDLNKVFIVHGRDGAAQHETARLVERLGLEAIVLHEKPNQGQTIIEKLIQNGNGPGFAIVLLTPDDLGHLQGKPENARPRARQNVVFELGFFIAKLGRSRVCALVKGDLEIPNDISGVVYIPMDEAGGWKVAVAKELSAAGFAIDLNLLKAF